MKRGRRYVDDLAVFLIAHVRQHGFDAFNGAAHVDGHHLVPLVGTDLEEWFEGELAEDRGVVDQDVHAAECLDRGVYRSRERRRIEDIGNATDGAMTGRG